MNRIFRIYHPEIFQGSLKKRNYFEGWYFKHVSADLRNTFAVIPGISLAGDDSHSFVQYIDGNTGKSAYFRYGISDFFSNDKRFEIHIGKSYFSEHGIDMELENDEYSISGRIVNSGITKLKRKILRPGIMGWYSFVPSMECNHGIVSSHHKLTGTMRVNEMTVDMAGGTGYIEKDWGTSFPECWIWVQCNNFIRERISVMISIAKIPWRGKWFIGTIAFISMDDRAYILATYNGAKVEKLKRIEEGKTVIEIRKGRDKLSAVITKKGTGILKAPSMGLMANFTKESLDSVIEIEYRKDNHLIFTGTGTRAGYEETDKIFTYFSK